MYRFKQWGAAVLSLCLAAALAAGNTAGFTVRAESAAGEEAAGAETGSYAAYRKTYEKKPLASKTMSLTGASCAELSADTVRKARFDGREDVLLWDAEGGWAQWTVTVPKAGLYNLRMTYEALPGKGADPVFSLRINGGLPFSEAGHLVFTRIWKDDLDPDAPFQTDAIGNDIAPDKVEVARWNTDTFRDREGTYGDPYLFYLDKGDNTLRLTGVQECAAVAEIELYREAELPTYEEYAASAGGAQQNAAGVVRILQAERADEYSSTVLTASYDRGSAATQPSDPAVIRRNTLGGSGWAYTGQWAAWRFTVPEDGYYKISLKYRQNFVRGLYTTRRIRLDGAVPFRELDRVKFPYSSRWESLTLGNGGTDFLFYLTAGETHEIALEAIPGDMTESLETLGGVWESLTALYQKIVMITGASPDIYFDYSLDTDIPGLTGDLMGLSKALRAETAKMEAILGKSGSVANTLVQLADQMDDFAEKPFSIAPRLAEFRENISSLAAWIQSRRQQPLELDYLTVYSADGAAPSPRNGFFTECWYQIKLFGYSFLMDYNNVSGGSGYEENIEVWVGSGRDQMYILRSLIDSGFSPEKSIGVTLKLVSSAILPQAIMAGIGPDVALDATRSLPVDMALRGVLHPLEGFEGFDEVKARFMSTAMEPYTLQGGVYALPQTEIFNMLFYRADVLAGLGQKPPDTWDDMYRMISVLQRKNMEIGVPADVSTYYMLLLQNGGRLYNDDGTATELDADVAVEAFVEWCQMYTQYNFSQIKSDLNRFKSGEMPITIMPYNFYCQLLLAAPEIKGKWAMAPVPGVRREDGTVDRSDSGVSAGSTGCVMLAGTASPDAAWAFMNWFTSTGVQGRYGRKIEEALGTASRYTSSNVEAMASLNWTADERKTLQTQWANIREIPEMPGAYYITRNLQNAFRASVFAGAMPRDMLRQWNGEINREITRKRQTYGLPTFGK